MTEALTVRSLKKRYLNGFEAVKGVDFSVSSGDFFALLGPNGAGKSTVLGIIAGLVQKTAGSVHIYGHSIETERSKASRILGVVPQEINCNQFETVFNVLCNQAGYYGIPQREAIVKSQHYLQALGLWEKRHVVIRNLSGGMKRRVMIARALVHSPRLLLLDEPSAGLDVEFRRALWDFIRMLNEEEGMTVILTTHYLEEAEALCNQVAIIDAGHVIQHTSISELLRQSTQRSFILDIECVGAWKELENDNAHIELSWQDEHHLNVTLRSECSLNDLFSLLTKQGVKVLSMRTKSNRLEELFIHLTAD